LAFAEGPLPVWIRKHVKANHYEQRRNWIAGLLTTGMRTRALREVARKTRRGNENVERTPAGLTAHIKKHAAALGLSAIGIARYNPLYTFGPYVGENPGDHVIVCVLEQNWEATQSIPSLRAEIAHFVTYGRQQPMVQQLADEIERLGFRAVPGNSSGRAVAIYYGVEAGLGQLGLNGQLLTPFAGSRCRLMLIQTDMPLVADEPVDYGIPGLCDACQVCVRRCPPGAITNKREWHRGVYKAKIKPERCFPITAQAQGCGVCMKVCPVQRYGLPAVLEEFTRSGRILGKGTDELEGYVWPMDGKRYGPNERPKEAVSDDVLYPIDFSF
jgi:ferredoxin